jgi:hypothetical protein
MCSVIYIRAPAGHEEFLGKAKEVSLIAAKDSTMNNSLCFIAITRGAFSMVGFASDW